MFAISTDGCHSIRRYAAAKQHYESIKPIRGKPYIRPIGYREKQHMRITEDMMDGVHYYAAVLYNTECVRWFEDGRIQVRTDGYTTQSTSKFIAAVSPFNTALFDNHLWISGLGLGFSIPMADGRVGLTFKYNETKSQWECLNPPELYTRSYNKRETARLRKLPVIQKLQAYLKSMRALGAWEKRSMGYMHGTDRILWELLHNAKDPHYEPTLDDMAKLGEALSGVLNPEMLYNACLNVELTSIEALYVETPVPIGTMKRGVMCR